MGRINERDASAVGSQAADGGVEGQGIKSGEKKENPLRGISQAGELSKWHRRSADAILFKLHW